MALLTGRLKFTGLVKNIRWFESGVTRGSRGGRPLLGAGEKTAQNGLTEIYFDIFWWSKGAQN